jgi:hypothetical protein
MDKESEAKSAVLWDALFLAVLKLTKAGEINWKLERGGLWTDIHLLCDEQSNEHGQEIGAISVLAEDETFPPYEGGTHTSEAATTLHKCLRDKYSYSAEEFLSAVIAATPGPTTLPTWQTNPIEAEDVG